MVLLFIGGMLETFYTEKQNLHCIDLALLDLFSEIQTGDCLRIKH